ncbi:MAG: asparagine synthase-related protein [Polyangiaceae bacterium]
MSALAALLHLSGGSADPDAVRSALEAQAPRGPEARRTWAEGPIALGHGMLATTPEDDFAPQPFVTRDGSAVVLLDGRIDNRDEIAQITGVREDRAADVELVAAAYARFGDRFAQQLLGDFAVIVWDARRREMLCAKDPLASRSLYVRATKEAIRCASEPLALFAKGFAEADARPRPRFDSMARLLVEQHVEERATMLEDVETIPAGGTRIFGADGRSRSIAPAWPRGVAPSRLRTAAEHEEALRAALIEAVRVRMRAKGRVAIHVSGGLDSSSVAALAAEIARGRGEAPPLLVRCVFPGLSCDESEMSQAVADHVGLPIESVTMPGDPADFAPAPSRGRPYEHPISMMLVRLMTRTNELGARVTLTGAGSDQFLFPTGLEMQGALRRGDVVRALAIAGVTSAPLSPRSYVKLAREGVMRALPIAWRRAVRRWRGLGDGLPTWMTEAARAAVRRSWEPAPSRVADLDFPSPASRDLASRIAGNVDYSYSLVMADRIAGHCSAEMRHPFFDPRVIDLLLSFPDDVRSAGPPPKLLLRRAMGPALPEVVRDRRSAAEFSVLVRRALVEPHGETLAAMLRHGRLVEEGLVDGAGAAAAVDRARTEDGEAIRDVMMLAWLEMWLREATPT